MSKEFLFSNCRPCGLIGFQETFVTTQLMQIPQHAVSGSTFNLNAKIWIKAAFAVQLRQFIFKTCRPGMWHWSNFPDSSVPVYRSVWLYAQCLFTPHLTAAFHPFIGCAVNFCHHEDQSPSPPHPRCTDCVFQLVVCFWVRVCATVVKVRD